MNTLFAWSGALLVYCLIYMTFTTIFSKKITMQQRLDEMSKAGNRQVENDELNKPFEERFVKPTLGRIISFFAVLIPVNAASEERLNQQLKQAEIRMGAREYQAAVLLFTLVCVVGMVLYSTMLGLSVGLRILFGMLGIYAGLVLSRFYLKRNIIKRKTAIYHQLPDTLDLLSVSVSAGLGFDQALSYVVEHMEGPLIQELDTTQREISMGIPRKEALERLAARCECDEIYIFVGAINQADELGASIKNVMETQAAAIRLTHKQNVEEQAQKLSVKMMVPMVLFILPVTFIIILGPAIPSVISALKGV